MDNFKENSSYTLIPVPEGMNIYQVATFLKEQYPNTKFAKYEDFQKLLHKPNLEGVENLKISNYILFFGGMIEPTEDQWQFASSVGSLQWIGNLFQCRGLWGQATWPKDSTILVHNSVDEAMK